MKIGIKKIIFSVMVCFGSLLSIPLQAEAAMIITSPKLMIDSYTIEGDAVVPGQEFTIKLNVHNMSKSKAVSDIMITCVSRDGSIYPVYGQSAQLYIEGLEKDKSTEVEITLEASSEIKDAYVPLILQLSYSEANNTNNSNEISLMLPVALQSNLAVQNYSVPETATVGTLARVSVTYQNSGALALENIVLHIRTSDDTEETIADMGRLAGGEKKFVEAYVDFKRAGTETIYIYFTYEDEDGNSYTYDIQESMITVTESTNSYTETSNEDEQHRPTEGNKQRLLSSSNIVIIILVTAIIALVILVLTQYRKHKS